MIHIYTTNDDIYIRISLDLDSLDIKIYTHTTRDLQHGENNLHACE